MIKMKFTAPNFVVSENINGLKNQPVKMRFSGVNFNVAENINQSKFGLVKNDYFISDVNVA